MHPAQHQALRTLVQQAVSQLQGAYQTLALLTQTLSQTPPQQTMQQQATQQHYDGGSQYMSPQEDQALSGAVQNAQTQAQQAFQEALAAQSGHFGRPQQQQRRAFTPPGGQPQQGFGGYPAQQQPSPQAFQSPAGAFLNGLGMDEILG